MSFVAPKTRGEELDRWPRRHYTISEMRATPLDNPTPGPTAFATRLGEKVTARSFPSPAAWQKARPLRFDRDWRGENPDPLRRTEVRLLWAPDGLYLRFHCQFRTITVFPDARADGWRYELWDGDVAEAFLQPDPSDPLVYTEFEVSPNGQWIDLAVSHGKIAELHSGLRRHVEMDEKSRIWTAQLAIPMKSLTAQFDPSVSWRANFFRVEGQAEPRFYAAWSRTGSPRPNFHVPSAFGRLAFRE